MRSISEQEVDDIRRAVKVSMYIAFALGFLAGLVLGATTMYIIYVGFSI